jgi:putative transposon-encoded protein
VAGAEILKKGKTQKSGNLENVHILFEDHVTKFGQNSDSR